MCKLKLRARWLVSSMIRFESFGDQFYCHESEQGAWTRLLI
ncbi:hypothetical protein BRC2024_OFSGVTRC_CDS_0106 [Acinetobacter phage vB_AbaM_Rocket]